MTYSEKSSVGATILPSSDLPKPSYPAVILEKPSLESLDSSYAMSAANHMPASKEEYDPTSTNPCSAFYSHPTTRTSFEQQKTESKTNIRIYEHDLESGSQVVVPMKRESKALVEKIGKKDLCCQRRSFNPMRRLSKKPKIWVKMIIALIIIGAAVGLGLGIALVTLSYSANHSMFAFSIRGQVFRLHNDSIITRKLTRVVNRKATGTGVWKNANSQTEIGDGGD